MGLFHRKKQKKIVVQKGMNIRKNYIGSKKGAYFEGTKDVCDTYLMGNKEYRLWVISFVDLAGGALYRKKFRDALWIGRAEEKEAGRVSLVLGEDLRISKRHCVIYEREGWLYLEDLGSRNHTYLNGRCVTEPIRVCSGDIIKIGATKLKMEFGKG